MNEKELTRLIILGAGASVDCGVYPLGSELVKIAKEVQSLCAVKNNGQFSSNFVEDLIEDSPTQFSRDKIKKFVPKTIQNLVESSHASIDSHIVYVRNLEERNFLKSLILATILSCTSYSKLCQNFDQNWYSEIAKLIFPTISNEATSSERLDAIEKKLKALQIVTFNYDVSLELYLLDRLKDFFGEESDTSKPLVPYSKQALRKIMDKIHHVYGQIYDCDELFWTHHQMSLPRSEGQSLECRWQEEYAMNTINKGYTNIAKSQTFNDLIKSSVSGINYRKEAFCNLVLKYALMIDDPDSKLKVCNNDFSHERIRVIKEDERSSKIEKVLSDKIEGRGEGWDLVYILGYGFDQDNNQLLHFDQIKQYRLGCFITNYGGNKKIERAIYTELANEVFYEDFLVAPDDRVPPDFDDYVNPHKDIEYHIPMVSSKDATVKKALDDEFGLLEKPKSPLKIKTDLTPYLAMRNASLAR